MRITCAVCGKHDVVHLYTVGTRHIVRCIHDSLVYVDPQPTDATLNRWYNEGYFTDTKRQHDDYLGYYAYLDEKPLLLSYFKKKIAQIETIIPQGVLLEVGCGYGFFLEAAKKTNLIVTGIDISRDAVSYAKQHGGNARVLSLTPGSFPYSTFDGVVAFQLIEHLRNPSAFLRTVYNSIKPGGMVLFTTPDEGGYLKRILGVRWMGFRHREHLYFFSPRTITVLLTKAGFTDIQTAGDEIRFYPVRFLLAGAPHYVGARWFTTCIIVIKKVLSFLGCLDMMVPLPLNTLVITARKSKES